MTLRGIGNAASELITSVFASWWWISTYSLLMAFWVVLHSLGVLHVDSEDLWGWRAFMAWFSGAQATIVLMSSRKGDEERDRAIRQGVDLDKKQLVYQQESSARIQQLLKRIDGLESLLTLMEQEDHGKVRKIKDSPKGKVRPRTS